VIAVDASALVAIVLGATDAESLLAERTPGGGVRV